jgi:hypothetical protein
MSQTLKTMIAAVGIDIGKNSFHVVGLDQRGAIVLRQKWSRGQVEARFANMPPCLIGMEACVGANHLRTSATTSESLCARAPCGDVARGGGIPGVPIGQYADRHDRHASDSQTLGYRRLEA